MGLKLPWKKLATWAIEQAAKWGIQKIEKKGEKKPPSAAHDATKKD